jgi:hypothetical protein
MKVVFKPGNTYEEVNCFDFREYERGIVLRNEDGYNIGYVPPRDPQLRRAPPRGGGHLR